MSSDLFVVQQSINDFFAFMASPVTLLAIMCYIYLEVAFQINYTDTVTKPSLERSEIKGELRNRKNDSSPSSLIISKAA